MDEQVYNEIRNRKERLKQSIKEKLKEGGDKDETLKLMLYMLDNCKININDFFRGVETYEEKKR